MDIILRSVQNNAPYNFSKLQHLVNPIDAYLSKGLWELTHQFWCLVIHAWASDDRGALGVQLLLFLMTLMLVHVSSKKKNPIETFNRSFQSTLSKQPRGTKITCTEVKNIYNE